MNEVTRIHLGRQQFVVAVDAHKTLQDYLRDIEKQVGHDKEVMKEIELRMAELLEGRGAKDDKVVLAEDVAYLREQLGEPSAFSGDEKPAGGPDTESEPAAQRRLFRDTDEAYIAGVCSGLSAFTGINAWIFRLLFIVLTFSGAVGIVIYILLWILIPPAKTSSERLQMRGKQVTVDAIKKVVERADVEGAAQRVSGVFERTMRRMSRFLAILIGSLVAAAASLGIVALGAALTYVIVHHDRMLYDVMPFPSNTLEWTTVGMCMLTLSLLLILILFAGISLVHRKWILPLWATIVTAALMLLSAGVTGALLPDTIRRANERYDAYMGRPYTPDPRRTPVIKIY